VNSIAARFKTEYNSKFINWTAKVNMDLYESKVNGGSNKKADLQGSENAKTLENDTTQEKSKDFYRAGLPSSGGQMKSSSNNPNILFDSTRRSHKKRLSSNGSFPVDYIQIQSIYKSLKPAGLAVPEGWKERRHYFDIGKITEPFYIEKGSTWELANDVLERCRIKKY
jgi:hypothetical protein